MYKLSWEPGVEKEKEPPATHPGQGKIERRELVIKDHVEKEKLDQDSTEVSGAEARQSRESC